MENLEKFPLSVTLELLAKHYTGNYIDQSDCAVAKAAKEHFAHDNTLESFDILSFYDGEQEEENVIARYEHPPFSSTAFYTDKANLTGEFVRKIELTRIN